MIARLTEIEWCYRMDMNVKKTKIMRISPQQSHIQIMIHKKQHKNVHYFNYLGTITNHARCIHEIKSRIVMAKAAFNKKTPSTSKLDLNLRKKLVKCYI
jgi:hypothetical protein